MAGEPLVEELTLDISPALSALEPLGTAFEEIIAGFTSSLGEGISSALGNISGLDTSALTASVEGALTEATATPLPIEADTASLDASLADALDEPREIPVDGDVSALDTSLSDVLEQQRDVPLDADTSGLVTSIDDATSATQDVPLSADASELVSAIEGATADTQTVPVDADVLPAQTAIDGLTAAPIDIEVTADTTQAEDQIVQLGNAADDSSSSVEGLAGSADALSASSGLAKGEVGELGGFIANIGPQSAAAVSGVAAFAAFVATATTLAADGQVSNKAFADTFGDVAESVREINVGGLVISLDDLGKQSGTTSASLEDSAVKVGLLGNAAGAAKPQIAGTASDLLGIAGALSVSNPRLGDAAAVADTLTKAFATGRTRGLQPYGITLSQNAILQEALRQNVGKTAEELTAYDKVVAGVTLTQQQFGDSLGTKFSQGAQNAQVQLRAVKVEIEETLAAVGGPLLDPLVTSLQAVLPVAQEVGRDLGSLAQIVLPLVAALAPALAPVAGVLHLVGDGLDAIAGAVDAIPPPVLLGIAAGAVAIGAGFGIAELGVAGFATAIETALGPIGATLAIVGLLGGAVDLFGSDAASAVEVAGIFGDSLFGAQSGADSLSGQLALLDQNINKVAQDIIKGFGSDAASQSIRKALDTAGGGAKGLAAALSGTQEEFDAYTKSVAAATDVQGPWNAKIDASTPLLKQLRDGLRDKETEQLKNLVSTNQLTQADLDAVEARHKLADGSIDLAASLADASAIADGAAKKEALNAKIQSGAVREVVDAFLAGGESADVFAANLEALGFQSQDAAKFAQDLAAAQLKQTDATKIASPAVQALVAQFAAGTVSASEFEGGLVSLGVSLPGTADLLQQVSNAVDSFVTNATKLAPSLDSALTAAQKNQSQAQSDAAKAVESQGKAVESVRDSIDAAYQKIALAHQKGGKNSETAVKNAEVALVLAVGAGNKELDGAAQSVAETNLKLIAAADPQRIIDNLNKGLRDIADFEKNLAAIVKSGGTQLAESLAAQGPQIAGAQAAAFAQDPGGVKLSEALIGKTQAATSTYSEFLRTTFGPTVAAEIEAQSGVAGAAFHPDFQTPARKSVDDATAAFTAGEPVLNFKAGFAAQSASGAFGVGLTLPQSTATAVGGAQTALDGAKDPLGASAGAAGTHVGGEFSGGMDLPGKTSGQIDASKSAWDGQATVDTGNSARRAGIGVGFQFDKGIAEGIGNGQGDIDAAARTAAARAESAAKRQLGISSPSQVGIEIGGQFVEGIALGLSDTGPVTAAAAEIAQAAAGATRGALTTALAPLNIGDTAQIDAAVARLHQLEDAEARQKQAAADFAAAHAALDSFVSSAVGQLPAASAAISTFGSNVKSAIADVQKAEEAASKARTKLQTDESKLQGALILAQRQVAADLAHGASLRQIFLDQDKVNKAQHALTVATLLDTKDIIDSNTSLAASRDALAKASSPDDFIRTIQANTKNAAQFEADLKKLVAEKFPLLAQELAKAGPDTAKKLADALAGAPAKAKLAEAALEQAAAFSDEFSDTLSGLFAPSNSAALTAVGQNAGAAIGKGAVDSLTAAGDVLFSSLTDPFKGQSLTIPVKLDTPQLSVTPAGPLAIQTPTHADSFSLGGVTTLEFDLNLTLADGTVVPRQRVTAAVTRTSATKATARADMTGRARA